MAQQTPHAPDTSHETSFAQYIVVWIGLLGLTGLTVALAGIGLGRFVIMTALVIASIKSGLVLSVFMHLRSEDRMFRLFALVAVGTLAVFFVLMFFDYAFH